MDQTSSPTEKRKKFYTSKWFWVVALVITVAIIYKGLMSVHIAPHPIGLFFYYFIHEKHECTGQKAHWCEQNQSFECVVLGSCVG